MLQSIKQIRDNAVKTPVKAATTGALAANTYNNGTAGQGATLTSNANVAFPTIDGQVINIGDRILVKNETGPNAPNNGIYTFTQQGVIGTNPWILTRAQDCDSAIKIFPGMIVVASSGTQDKSEGFTLQTAVNPITVGTDNLTFTSMKELMLQTPSAQNKFMTASLTAADGDLACSTAIVGNPQNYVEVFVNGIKVKVANGAGEQSISDCWFASTGSPGTAKVFGPVGDSSISPTQINTGDKLYWKGSVAGYQLSTSDIIDFDFMA